MADRALQILAPRYKSWLDTGAVNSGGKIYFYEAGTTTLKDTYSDAEATAANANPVVLDTRGEAAIYGRGAYKIVEKTSADVQIGDAMDGVLFLDTTDDIQALLNDSTTAAMRATLGLGDAATKTAGTSAGNVLLMDVTGQLPALDASLLTDVAAGQGPLPYGYLSGLTLSSSPASGARRRRSVCKGQAEGRARSVSISGQVRETGGARHRGVRRAAAAEDAQGGHDRRRDGGHRVHGLWRSGRAGRDGIRQLAA